MGFKVAEVMYVGVCTRLHIYPHYIVPGFLNSKGKEKKNGLHLVFGFLRRVPKLPSLVHLFHTGARKALLQESNDGLGRC